MRRGEVRAEGRSVGGRVSEEAKRERLEAKGGVSAGGGSFQAGGAAGGLIVCTSSVRYLLEAFVQF